MSNDKEEKKVGVQEKIIPSPISKQAAYNKASSHFYEAFATILDVMKTSKNDNARLGAANTIMDKVIPDLKATELSTDEKSKFIFQIIKDSTLEDARDKDSTNNSKLQSSGNDLPESSKV